MDNWKWYNDFLKLYFEGHYKEAFKLKHKFIPKLYKFQPFCEERISAVINNKIWFSLPKELNDPFDGRGVYWETEEIRKYLYKNSIIKDINFDVDKFVYGAVSTLRDGIKITCFSENLYSMPIWAHYADNHKGFCIEYDFSTLDYENEFSKYLFPVGYEPHRYNITNLIELSLKNNTDPRIKLLYFLMSLKHNSWSYEKEWRIMKIKLPEEKKFESGLVDCPFKPTAIYLGVNFDLEKTPEFYRKLSILGVPIYKLKIGNSKFFDLESVEL